MKAKKKKTKFKPFKEKSLHKYEEREKYRKAGRERKNKS